jgi:hypothetical protein
LITDVSGLAPTVARSSSQQLQQNTPGADGLRSIPLTKDIRA